MGMPTAEADFFLWHFRGMDASHGRRTSLPNPHRRIQRHLGVIGDILA